MRLVWLRKYKLPILHIVIYLGERKVWMPDLLPENEVYRGFDLINLFELDAEQLLQSQIPEVILLAVLSNYTKEQSESILRKIFQRLSALSTEPKELSRYVNQLIVLSRLRKLEVLSTQLSQNMPVHIKIEEDGLYLMGVQKGKEEGIEIGKEEGIEIGREEGIEIGREKGIEIGREEGIEKGREEEREFFAKERQRIELEIAERTRKAVCDMILRGVDTSALSIAFDLPLERILQYKKELQQEGKLQSDF